MGFLFRFVIWIALIGGLVCGTVGYVAYDYQRFLERPLDIRGDGLLVNLPTGSSVATLSGILVRSDAMQRPPYFQWYARSNQLASKLKAGEYLIKPGMTPVDALNMIVEGRSMQYGITLIEGRTFKQLRAELNQREGVQHDSADLSDEEIMTKIGAVGIHPEGQFLPDTYFFPRNVSDLDVLKRSYQAMQEERERIWQQRSDQTLLRDSYEMLILASIIEKETGIGEERPHISGVFNRRLEYGMKLQTDPTVIYGLGDNYLGQLLGSDLRRDTPYNTYTRAGLPPTPIAMPGRAAMEAAVNPLSGNTLYFVAVGDGSGRHVFSATLEEHNRAVREYRKRQQ